MRMQCPVCHDEFGKLKVLTCRHAFCLRCLQQIKEDNKVLCPCCRAETTLSPFGLQDLTSKFAGQLTCNECQRVGELEDSGWCGTCKFVLCNKCKETHTNHNVQPATELGPVTFCAEQLDKFCTLHTTLASVQKDVVTMYTRKFEQYLHKMLDDDLQNRLKRFKQDKKWLETAFDLDQKADQSPTSASARAPMPDSTKLLPLMQQIMAIAPDERPPIDLIQREGPVFFPVALDELGRLVMKRDKFSTIGTDLEQMHLGNKDLFSPVEAYIGSGHLSSPCDMLPVVSNKHLWVTSTTHGVYQFSLEHRTFIKRFPSTKLQQFTSLAFCEVKQRIYVSSLDNYVTWGVKVFNVNFELQELILCPNDPHVVSSWHRWLSLLDENRLVLIAGDEKVSAIWWLDLTTKQWALVKREENATLRRAAVRSTATDYVLFCPDMHCKKVRTYVLRKSDMSLDSYSEIENAEMRQGLPVSIDVQGETMLFGYWLTGRVVVAHLDRARSHTVAEVGPRNLFALRLLDDKVYVLCKQTEVVQVYDLKSSMRS